jgi:hypothetical protein
VQRERDKLKTSAVICLNIIGRAQARGISKDMGTRSRPKITRTSSEIFRETKTKHTGKWLGPEVVLLTGPIRWLKGRASPGWLRTVLKWEASIRKREAEVIAPTRPAANSKARKNQASPDGARPPLKAPGFLHN